MSGTHRPRLLQRFERCGALPRSKAPPARRHNILWISASTTPSIVDRWANSKRFIWRATL